VHLRRRLWKVRRDHIRIQLHGHFQRHGHFGLGSLEAVVVRLLLYQRLTSRWRVIVLGLDANQIVAFGLQCRLAFEFPATKTASSCYSGALSGW
jgi:hypothetical protein